MEESLHLIAIDRARAEFDELTAIIYTLPKWQGKLKDAAVAAMAIILLYFAKVGTSLSVSIFWTKEAMILVFIFSTLSES